jgi:hypothetical protein
MACRQRLGRDVTALYPVLTTGSPDPLRRVDTPVYPDCSRVASVAKRDEASVAPMCSSSRMPQLGFLAGLVCLHQVRRMR